MFNHNVPLLLFMKLNYYAPEYAYLFFWECHPHRLPVQWYASEQRDAQADARADLPLVLALQAPELLFCYQIDLQIFGLLLRRCVCHQIARYVCL